MSATQERLSRAPLFLAKLGRNSSPEEQAVERPLIFGEHQMC